MKQLRIDYPEAGAARLTVSQPGKRNAVNAAMWAALPERLRKLQTDDNLRALIVTGDGDHFAAGADISEFETLYATPESAARISADIQRGFEALAAVRVPTIAMIRGACVGGGCGLALCCDIRIADRTAIFKIAPASLGLVYPFGDIARLIDAIGIADANEILLTGKGVKAKAAKKMGFLHAAVGVDDLEAEVMDIIRRIKMLSPESLRVTKSMITAYRRGQRTDTPKTDAQFAAGFTSKDFGEGFKAFLEKREPDFG
jgi:enoyl-CoA hydratase/carnithine racemase